MKQNNNNNNNNSPLIIIENIEFKGFQRTNNKLFENEFKNSKECQNFQQLYNSLMKTTKRLETFGIFSSVDTLIKINPNYKNNKLPVTIIVDVKEKNIPFLKVESFFGTEGNGVGASIQGALRNITGYGETSKISYGSTNTRTNDFQIGINFPSITENKLIIDSNIKVYEDNSLITFSSFSKKIASFSISCSSFDRKHSADITYSFRDEIPKSQNFESNEYKIEENSLVPQLLPSNFLKPNLIQNKPNSFINSQYSISQAILQTILPSTKTSFSYSYTHIDSRDSISNPTKGQFLLSKLELAIPPGSTQFLKLESFIEKHFSLNSILGIKISPTTFSLGSSIGTIHSILNQSKGNSNNNNNNINLSDRFFLGGGLGLRGYQLAGIGPKSISNEGDALGGNFKFNSVAILSTSLPFNFPTSEYIKPFLFANIGTLINTQNNEVTISEKIISAMRASIGCGISYSLGPVRLEAYYAIPIKYSKNDNVKPFQLSIGVGINGNN